MSTPKVVDCFWQAMHLNDGGRSLPPPRGLGTGVAAVGRAHPGRENFVAINANSRLPGGGGSRSIA